MLNRGQVQVVYTDDRGPTEARKEARTEGKKQWEQTTTGTEKLTRGNMIIWVATGETGMGKYMGVRHSINSYTLLCPRKVNCQP